MRRRPIAAEPMSRLAIWARRLVAFALALAGAAFLLTRGEYIEETAGQVILLYAFGLAALGIFYGAGALVAIWRNGNPGLGRALTALFLAGLLLAYPAWIAARGFRLPPIADITTDPRDPPAFDVIARLRPSGANPVAYPEITVGQQTAAYPALATLRLAATPAAAYESAVEIANQRKWRILDTRSPLAGRRDGRIEAVALTPVMGWRDDIVIRVRGTGTNAVVDVRSASRYGSRDWGRNAARIRDLLTAIEEETAQAER